MNVIAPPKIGKSWLVIDLALSIATGRPWLGTKCCTGEVLILDNELHGETSANRIPWVARTRGMEMSSLDEHVYIENLRGKLMNFISLGPYLKQFQPGKFKVVILDAFYRFLPTGLQENDNGGMAGIYNLLDSYAEYLKCSFVLIHHTSKGDQSQKAITDVGAGAGSGSRATDTHLILRKHEEDDVVVMESEARSWPPGDARCLRWNFPIWVPDDKADPGALKKPGPPQKPPVEIMEYVGVLSFGEYASRQVIEDRVRKRLGVGQNKVTRGFTQALDAGVFDIKEDQKPGRKPTKTYGKFTSQVLSNPNGTEMG